MKLVAVINSFDHEGHSQHAYDSKQIISRETRERDQNDLHCKG